MYHWQRGKGGRQRYVGKRQRLGRRCTGGDHHPSLVALWQRDCGAFHLAGPLLCCSRRNFRGKGERKEQGRIAALIEQKIMVVCRESYRRSKINNADGMEVEALGD